MQTKSNLWAGATIWANLAIIFIIYAIANAGMNYLFDRTLLYGGSFSPWQAIWVGIQPTLMFLLSIFAIWLGVRSVLKVTPVDPQNIMQISFYSVLLPVLLQLYLIFVATGFWFNTGQPEFKPNYGLSIVIFLVSDAFILASSFYFLKQRQKNEDGTPRIASKFGLMGAIIILTIAVVFGIVRYREQVVGQQAYLEFLGSSQGEFDKSAPGISPNNGGVDELIKEAIDEERKYNLLALATTIGLYLTSVDDTTAWNKICAGSKLYRSIDGTRAVDGTGWLPLDLSKIPGGSPLSVLNVDPRPPRFYGFKCNTNLEYEFDAKFESQKYSDSAKNDKGNNPDLYEVGTNFNLIP